MPRAVVTNHRPDENKAKISKQAMTLSLENKNRILKKFWESPGLLLEDEARILGRMLSDVRALDGWPFAL